MTPEDEEEIKYRVKTIYERAYGMNAPNSAEPHAMLARPFVRRFDAGLPIGTCAATPRTISSEVESPTPFQFDTREISDDVLLTTGEETDE